MITRLFAGLASRLRQLRLRLRGTHLDGPVWLRAIEVPRHADRLRLGTGVALDRGVTLLVIDPGTTPVIEIGARTYVNRHTLLDASVGIVIGSDCMIGPFTYITDHDHQFGNDGRPASGPLISKPVTLGDRCWIGAHVSILKGVTIGAGAVVGAGSVVTKDVPAGAVVAGNPTRTLRPTASPSA